MPVQEADELDPFRGSIVSDDEEAVLENQGRTQTHTRDGSGEGVKKKKEVYIYPSAGVDVGHRRLGSAGTGIGGGAGTRVGGGGGDRMMTSAEMNMKSQFLMNLRPFGEESARSEESEITASGVGASISRSRLEVDREGMLSEDEDERAGDEEEAQLGPGSDFFR